MSRMSPLCLLCAALMLLGCDNEPDADAEEATEAPAEERMTIAVIPKGTTHVFWNSVHAGANRAAEALDVDVLWQGPAREDDRAGQIRVVEDMISRGVSGIVLAPLDANALVPVAREAQGEGIPVVIIDSDIAWQQRASFVATDNHRGGALAAERLGALLEGRGRAILMRYQEGSASTMAREAGFLETMRERFSDIELISTNQYGGATAETAYATAENLLVRFPDVQGIFCPNESTTFGMLRALQGASKAGTVQFVGFDSSEALVRGLGEGQIHGLVLQNPIRMGELGVRTLVARLRGEDVEARIDTGATMVTGENMGQAEMRELLSPDLERWLR